MITERTTEEIITFLFTSLGLLSILLILRYVPRQMDKETTKINNSNNNNIHIIHHIIFIILAACIIFFVPEYIHDVIFTQVGVVVVAFVIPIYESIKAITSINDGDDEVWLQYWIISGMCVCVCVLFLFVYIFLIPNV